MSDRAGPSPSRFTQWVFSHRLGFAQRLALAFAGVVIIGVVSGVPAGLTLLDLSRELTRLRTVAQPARAAVYEMEIAINDMGLAVTRYLQRPDPAHRRRFRDRGDDFRRLRATYEALADGPENEAAWRQADDAYRRLRRAGAAIMDIKDREIAAFDRLAESVDRIEGHVPSAGGRADDAGSSPASRARPGTKRALREDLAGLVLWLASRIGADTGSLPAAKPREPASIGKALEALRARPGSSNAQNAALAQSVEVARLAADEVIACERRIGVLLASFSNADVALKNVLQGKMERLAGAGLENAQRQVRERVDIALVLVASLGVIAVLAAVGAVVILSRGVAKPLRTVTCGAQRIRDGDLRHRIELPVPEAGEIGGLARAFNCMASKLAHNHERMRTTNKELEAAVSRRTAQLGEVNKRLRRELENRRRAAHELKRAKEAAEAANHAKTLFLANMSHELRTPLNAVIGFAEILESEMFGPLGESEKYPDYIRDIRVSAVHLLGLINNLLSVAQIEAGRMEIRRVPVDVNAVLDAALRLTGPRAEEKGVRLTHERDDGLPSILGDELRLKQVFLNLLDNAIKFTPEGGAVTVTTAQDPEGGVAVTFADTGVGIAAEDIPKALEMFGPSDRTVCQPQDGAGIGLALSKKFIELHEGTLEIDSTPGVGTRVTVVLPERQKARRQARLPAPAAA